MENEKFLNGIFDEFEKRLNRVVELGYCSLTVEVENSIRAILNTTVQSSKSLQSKVSKEVISMKDYVVDFTKDKRITAKNANEKADKNRISNSDGKADGPNHGLPNTSNKSSATVPSSNDDQLHTNTERKTPSAQGLDDKDIKMAEEVMLKVKRENIDEISALENFNISDIFEKGASTSKKDVTKKICNEDTAKSGKEEKKGKKKELYKRKSPVKTRNSNTTETEESSVVTEINKKRPTKRQADTTSSIKIPERSSKRKDGKSMVGESSSQHDANEDLNNVAGSSNDSEKTKESERTEPEEHYEDELEWALKLSMNPTEQINREHQDYLSACSKSLLESDDLFPEVGKNSTIVRSSFGDDASKNSDSENDSQEDPDEIIIKKEVINVDDLSAAVNESTEAHAKDDSNEELKKAYDNLDREATNEVLKSMYEKPKTKKRKKLTLPKPKKRITAQGKDPSNHQGKSGKGKGVFESNEVKCDQCNFVCSSMDDIIPHVATKHNKKYLKCAQCDYKSDTMDSIMEHMNVAHNKSKVLTPMNRNKDNSDQNADNQMTVKLNKVVDITTISASKDQERMVKEKELKCVQCEFRCETRKNFLEHMSAKHTKVGGIVPLNTGKYTSNKGNVAKNITGSNKTNPLLNLLPSVPLVNGKSKLINDRILDYGKPLQTKESASSKDDIIPVATVKDNIKKFICNHCGFQADYNIDLKQHIKEKHPLKSSPKKKKLLSKPILSLTYDKESDNSSQVTKDIQDHQPQLEQRIRSIGQSTKEHPLQQQLAKENQARHLQFEKRLNPSGKESTGQLQIPKLFVPLLSKNNFNCEHCEFKTDVKNTLLDHIKVKHKVFKCEECGYSALRKDHLVRHMKTVHITDIEVLNATDDMKIQDLVKCQHCTFQAKGQFKETELKKHVRIVHLAPKTPKKKT